MDLRAEICNSFVKGNTIAQRSSFLGNSLAAIIFPSDQISCDTGPSLHRQSTDCLIILNQFMNMIDLVFIFPLQKDKGHNSR